MKTNIWVIIPAYNEENSIVNVIRDLKNHNYKNIIVVDDGSRDKTFELSKKQNVVVLRHIVNRGQGAALRTGVEYALLHKAGIVVTFDADGQHQAKDIKKLIEPIVKKDVDVVLGSRFLKKSKVPFIRKLFLKGGALLFRIFYGAKVTDSHNGLRALSRNAALKIKITADGMEHASEIIEEICRKKIKYNEVPVSIKYTEYSLKHGQRSLNAFKILFEMFFRKFLR